METVVLCSAQLMTYKFKGRTSVLEGLGRDWCEIGSNTF